VDNDSLVSEYGAFLSFLTSEGFELYIQPNLGFARTKPPDTAKYIRKGIRTIKLGHGIDERVVELKLRGNFKPRGKGTKKTLNPTEL